MPIYEYRCESCSKHFEKRQSVSDAPLTVCEECGGKLEKQWSLSGFQFKGAGWYVTDYSGKTATGGEKKSAGESTAPADTASNSKTETPAKTAADS